jgi:membrane protease YdiL (CAAX protease family)
MSLSSSVPPQQAAPKSRLKALLTVTAGTVLFLTVVGLVSKGLHWLLQAHIASTLRSRTTLTLSGSALGEAIVLALLILFLRIRGRSLRDLGLWQPSPLRGWILAAVMTALYVWIVFTSELRGHAGTTEVSAFHIYNSLVAGLSAGIVEEMFFRGFVMNQLRWSGFGAAFQVIASGLLFGVAHVGWGLLAAKPQWNVALGAMVATSILGILYALIYLGSRRSLMPVIIGHSLMDLLIEPWLVLVTLAGTTAQLHK